MVSKKKKFNYAKCKCHRIEHDHTFNDKLICSRCDVTWSSFNLSDPMAICKGRESVLPLGKPHGEA